jgi:D-galactonate transporter
MEPLEARTIAKVSARFLPLLIVCYFIAYLDRVNVSFAALTMNRDLGLSATAYGLGAGIFFLAYFLFEVPSNLLLVRYGARRWIARIMFSWGLLSGAMAFIGGPTSFYVVRVLLGIAEAGFFPGIIFFLTLWFPAVYRARIIGYFMTAIPLSTVIGAPASGLLLGLDGALGIKGWQWLFVIEAIPALILSFVVFFYLTDRPAEASWLAADERAWLETRLDREQKQRETLHHPGLAQALLNPRVLALGAVYFGVVATNYGLTFFLPQIVQGFGISNAVTGVISAIPYLCGVIGMVFWGRRSDRTLERRFHLVAGLLVAATGMAVAAGFDDPALKMLAFCIAGFGIFASMPVFWTLPTAFLSGTAAAGGIAMINSIGNLAGFAAPYAMGWVKDATGSYAGGLLMLAASGAIAAVIVLALGHERSLEQPPN